MTTITRRTALAVPVTLPLLPVSALATPADPARRVSNQYRRTLLRGGELVISLVGNPGAVAMVPGSLAGANIARQAGLSVSQLNIYHRTRRSRF